jgi:hypothetical protein
VDANDLVYLRARYYHPGLGVFTALDPIEQVNRYQYVSSNPVNHTDSSGLQGGTGALVGTCATLIASPFDFVLGDIGCVAAIAGLILLGVIDWEEVAQASEDLYEKVSWEVSKLLEAGGHAAALPEPTATVDPRWTPTIITPVPAPSPGPTQQPGGNRPPLPTVFPIPFSRREPNNNPDPRPTVDNPTSCPTQQFTPTATTGYTPTPTPTLTATQDCNNPANYSPQMQAALGHLQRCSPYFYEPLRTCELRLNEPFDPDPSFPSGGTWREPNWLVVNAEANPAHVGTTATTLFEEIIHTHQDNMPGIEAEVEAKGMAAEFARDCGLLDYLRPIMAGYYETRYIEIYLSEGAEALRQRLIDDAYRVPSTIERGPLYPRQYK